MTYSSSIKTADGLPDLSYKPALARNIGSRILTIIAGLFAGIAERTAKGKVQFTVEVSYMEIYNEQV